MPNNRELSQLGNYINVNDNSETVGIVTDLSVSGVVSATTLVVGSVQGSIGATAFVKTGGTSSEFLKADGSVDSTTYINSVGIESSGSFLGGAQTINFIGAGNTFAVNGTTVDIAIAGVSSDKVITPKYVSTLGGAKDSVGIGSARSPLLVKFDDIGGPIDGFYRVLGFEGINRNNLQLGIGIGASVGPNPEDPEYQTGYSYSNTVLGSYNARIPIASTSTGVGTDGGTQNTIVGSYNFYQDDSANARLYGNSNTMVGNANFAYTKSGIGTGSYANNVIGESNFYYSGIGSGAFQNNVFGTYNFHREEALINDGGKFNSIIGHGNFFYTGLGTGFGSGETYTSESTRRWNVIGNANAGYAGFNIGTSCRSVTVLGNENLGDATVGSGVNDVNIIGSHNLRYGFVGSNLDKININGFTNFYNSNTGIGESSYFITVNGNNNFYGSNAGMGIWSRYIGITGSSNFNQPGAGIGIGATNNTTGVYDININGNQNFYNSNAGIGTGAYRIIINGNSNFYMPNAGIHTGANFIGINGIINFQGTNNHIGAGSYYINVDGFQNFYDDNCFIGKNVRRINIVGVENFNGSAGAYIADDITTANIFGRSNFDSVAGNQTKLGGNNTNIFGSRNVREGGIWGNRTTIIGDFNSEEGAIEQSDTLIVGNANVTTGIETGSGGNTIVGSYNAFVNNNPYGIRNDSDNNTLIGRYIAYDVGISSAKDNVAIGNYISYTNELFGIQNTLVGDRIASSGPISDRYLNNGPWDDGGSPGLNVNNTIIGSRACKFGHTGRNNTIIGAGAATTCFAAYSTIVGSTIGYGGANAGGIHGSGTTPILGFTAVGYGNAYNGTSGGDYNTLVGYANANTGINAGGNTFVGAFNANQSVVTGTNNSIIGAYCLNNSNSILSGTQNSLFGYAVAKTGVNGNYNAYFGSYVKYYAGGSSGASADTGSYNVMIGYAAGLYNYNADKNVYIGGYAGYNNSAESGGNNIAIGEYAGWQNHYINGGSNKIVIGNNSHNGAYIPVSWSTTSDIRDKNIIGTVPHGKDFINSLDTIEFQFKNRQTGENKDDIKRYGFSAQQIAELEGDHQVLIDSSDSEKLKLTDSYLIPILVNAVKELSQENKDLRDRLDKIEQHLNLE